MQGAGEKRERPRRVLVRDGIEGARIVSRERRPRAAPEAQLVWCDRRARAQQRRELLGVELTEAVKGLVAWILADADEAEQRPAEIAARAPVQMPDEQMLVEQVMLEPENDLVVVLE